MKRKTKDYGWPHMFYCKKDGSYLICASLAEVPDGFVDTRDECDVKPTGVEEPKKYLGPVPATASEKAVAAEDDGDEDETGDEGDDGGEGKEAEPQTLEDMGVTRKEAIAMLKEEGVKHSKNPKNAELAGLIEGLLEEEETEE